MEGQKRACSCGSSDLALLLALELMEQLILLLSRQSRAAADAGPPVQEFGEDVRHPSQFTRLATELIRIEPLERRSRYVRARCRALCRPKYTRLDRGAEADTRESCAASAL